MKVWWCEEHKAASASGYSNENVLCLVFALLDGATTVDCRMVPMRLVPADALVVEKVDGEWPEWALRVGYQKWELDVLAQASQVGESGR